MDPESLLRQRLAPEVDLQQWPQHPQDPGAVPPFQQVQHMAPPPARQQQIPTQQHLPQNIVHPQFNQPQQPAQPPVQSSSSEAASPRSATKTTRKKQPVRASRRRKTITVNTKDESDGSLSEEFTMEGVKTKSGRKVHKPAHFNPATKTPSRRRGPYRRNYDARICKVCQRGHSPQSNMIVFCDGCNTPYHQLCHDPPIDDLVIAVESAEWFCAGCAKSREQRPLVLGMSGAGLTDEEKRLYLASLPMSSLVEIIFSAEKAHPDLPLYDTSTKEIVIGIKNANAAKVEYAARDGTADLDDTGGTDWEFMIVRAIKGLGGAKGHQPKIIFEWISDHYPGLDASSIRPEAQSSLQAALRKGRLIREGHSYRINPAYVSSATATPKPQTEHGLLAPGGGIKLPPEMDEGGASMLVDDDAIAFSHRYREVVPAKQATVEDVMDGIVLENGFVASDGHQQDKGEVAAQ